ncbi:MAG: hypothetical protein ACP5FK_03620 [bacterium]
MAEDIIFQKMDEITIDWFKGVKEANSTLEDVFNEEKELIDQLIPDIKEIPLWAEKTRQALPWWGFEPCSHRWMEGLDEILMMIKDHKYIPTKTGRCGDTPSYVKNTVGRYLNALKKWMSGKKNDDREMAEKIQNMLGTLSKEKKTSVKCLIDLLESYLFDSRKDVQRLSESWKEKAAGDLNLSLLFYGDGLVGWLANSCGFKFLDSLEIYLQAIGGNRDKLPETRFVCNSQLIFAYRIDPNRFYVTHAYLWSLYVHLTGQNLDWLKKNKEYISGICASIFQVLESVHSDDIITRWLIAHFFSALKFWYMRMLNFSPRGQIPHYLQDVPEFPLK